MMASVGQPRLPDVKLYKYLAPDRLDVLERGTIRYSQPSALNDPFEVRPYIDGITDRDRFDRTLRDMLPSLVEEEYSKLPEQMRPLITLECFRDIISARIEAQGDELHRQLNSLSPVLAQNISLKFDEVLGILSLSETPDSLLMWSHYTCAHEGFVVGFDSAHPHFAERKSSNDEFRHLRPIEYRQDRPSAPLSEYSGTDVFLVKSTDWSYEREWRIMRALPDANLVLQQAPHPIYLFSFPPLAVAEVVVGARMTDLSRLTLTNLLSSDPRYLHVRVFQAVPDERAFVLKLVPIAG